VTAAWVEGVWEVARTGVTTDLVVVVEVERVACTWEVVKLLLLTGLATVEDRELLDVELVVVREDVVLVAANNLLVVLVGEDVVTPGEEVGAA